MKNLCDNSIVDLIITTGGTGLSKRDHTLISELEHGIKILIGDEVECGS